MRFRGHHHHVAAGLTGAALGFYDDAFGPGKIGLLMGVANTGGGLLGGRRRSGR